MSDKEQTIAERVFHIEGEQEAGPVLTFRLFRPTQPEVGPARCRYSLSGKTGVEEKEVTGVDGLDCIITCLAVAGSSIAGLNESVFSGRLRWSASPWGGRGLGLPTIEDAWPHKEAYQNALQWALDQQDRDRH